MTHTDYRVHLTLKSRNEKTGPIPVSTTSAVTCASACPFASGNGCYADGGPLAIHWRKVTQGLAGKPWVEFVQEIAALPECKLCAVRDRNVIVGFPAHGASKRRASDIARTDAS